MENQEVAPVKKKYKKWTEKNLPPSEIKVKKVLQKLGNGSRLSLRDAMLQAGYKESYANNPFMLLKTQAWKKHAKYHVESLNTIKDRILGQLLQRDLSEVDIDTLTKALERIEKTYQLILGSANDKTETTETKSIQVMKTLSDAQLLQIVQSTKTVTHSGNAALINSETT